MVLTCLHKNNPEGIVDSRIPLLSSTIVGEAVESDLTITVEQIYANKYDKPIEAKYCFTLDSNAIVNSLKLIVGDRVLNGTFKEKKQARESYTVATTEGKHALLLEKTENVYKICVGNIMPDEEVTIQYRYITVAAPSATNNDIVYVFPTNIAPKFDDRRIYPYDAYDSVYHTAKKRTYTFNLNLRWESRNKITKVESSTHDIAVTHESDYAKIISTTTIPTGGDISIRVNLSHGTSLYFHKSDKPDDNNVYVRAAVKLEYASAKNPKKYIIVVDRSGSMADRNKMIDTKHALDLFLDKMTPEDMINIISFGDKYEALFSKCVDCTPSAVLHAKKAVSAFEANMGGTYLPNCIDAIVNENAIKYYCGPGIDGIPHNIERATELETICLILTDGDIGSMSRIKETITKGNKKMRFFTIGIGKDLNRLLIEEVAHIGRGIGRVINDSANILDVITYIHAMTSAEYYIDLANNISPDVEQILYPDNILSYYYCLSVDEFKKLFTEGITFVGKNVEKYETKMWHCDFDEVLNCGPNLKTLYGAYMIKHMTDKYVISNNSETKTFTKKDYDTMMVELSMKYELVTDYVSLVVVDDDVVNKDGKMKSVSVPHYSAGGGDGDARVQCIPASAGGYESAMCSVDIASVISGYLLQEGASTAVYASATARPYPSQYACASATAQPTSATIPSALNGINTTCKNASKDLRAARCASASTSSSTQSLAPRIRIECASATAQPQTQQYARASASALPASATAIPDLSVNTKPTRPTRLAPRISIACASATAQPQTQQYACASASALPASATAIPDLSVNTKPTRPTRLAPRLAPRLLPNTNATSLPNNNNDQRNTLPIQYPGQPLGRPLGNHNVTQVVTPSPDNDNITNNATLTPQNIAQPNIAPQPIPQDSSNINGHGIEYESEHFDKNDIEISSAHCFRNHRCKIMHQRIFTCDVCETRGLTQITFMCKECNFDMCTQCFISKKCKWDGMTVKILKLMDYDSFYAYIGVKSKDELDEFATKIHIGDDLDIILTARLLYMNIVNLIKQLNDMAVNPNMKYLIDTTFSKAVYIASQNKTYDTFFLKDSMSYIYDQVRDATGVTISM